MKRRPLRLDEQLSSVPVKNESVKIGAAGDGDLLLVEVELRYSGWLRLLSKLLRPNRRKRFRLEGVGRQVYESIDGRKSFEELIDEFAGPHKLTFFESRALLMHYIEILMKRGLILIGVRKHD